MLKKLCSILLALFLVVCTSPIAFAEEVEGEIPSTSTEIETVVEEKTTEEEIEVNAAAPAQEQPQAQEKEVEKTEPVIEKESEPVVEKKTEKIEEPKIIEEKVTLKSAPAAVKSEPQTEEEQTYTVTYTHRVWDQWAECEDGNLLSEVTYSNEYKVGDEVWMPSIVTNGEYLFSLPGHPAEVLWAHAGTVLLGGGNPEELGAEFIYPDGYLIPSMIPENVDLIYNYGPLYDTVRCEDYMEDDNGEYQLVSSSDHRCSIGYDVKRGVKEIEGYTFNEGLSNLLVHVTLRTVEDSLYKLTRYYDKIKPTPGPEPDPGIPDPDPEPEPTPEPIIPTPTPTPESEKPVTPVTPVNPGGGGDGEDYELDESTTINTAVVETPIRTVFIPGITADEEETDNIAKAKTINEIKVPLAKTEETWALVNLICVVVTVVVSLILVILGWYNRWRRRNIELDEKYYNDYQFWLRNKIILRIVNLLIAIVSIVVFILTENIFLKLVFIDRFTPLMVVLAILAIGVAFFSKYVVKEYYPYDDDDEDGEE